MKPGRLAAIGEIVLVVRLLWSSRGERGPVHDGPFGCERREAVQATTGFLQEAEIRDLSWRTSEESQRQNPETNASDQFTILTPVSHDRRANGPPW
jgi:hypothetical protein